MHIAHVGVRGELTPLHDQQQQQRGSTQGLVALAPLQVFVHRAESGRRLQGRKDECVVAPSRSLALGIADFLLLLAIVDVVGGSPLDERIFSLGAVVAAHDEVFVAVSLAIRARDQHVRGDKLHQPAPWHVGYHALRVSAALSPPKT